MKNVPYEFLGDFLIVVISNCNARLLSRPHCTQYRNRWWHIVASLAVIICLHHWFHSMLTVL